MNGYRPMPSTAHATDVELMLEVAGGSEEALAVLHRRFARDPVLGPSVRALRGLRPRRTATVAHALLRAVCGQLIQSSRAREIERAVIRRSRAAVGRRASGAAVRCVSVRSRPAPVPGPGTDPGSACAGNRVRHWSCGRAPGAGRVRRRRHRRFNPHARARPRKARRREQGFRPGSPGARRHARLPARR